MTMSNRMFYITPSSSDLVHYGILGMKWGIRRYQNKDGSLTSAGQKRYAKYLIKEYNRTPHLRNYAVRPGYIDYFRNAIVFDEGLRDKLSQRNNIAIKFKYAKSDDKRKELLKQEANFIHDNIIKPYLGENANTIVRSDGFTLGQLYANSIMMGRRTDGVLSTFKYDSDESINNFIDRHLYK